MFTIIIFIVIAIIITLPCLIKDSRFLDFTDWIFSILTSIVISGLLGLLIAMLLPVEKQTVKITYKLETLQDKNGLDGGFFLGSGRIEDKMSYVFYYEKDGFFQMQQVGCDRAKIKYVNDTPKVEQYIQERIKSSFINNFSIGRKKSGPTYIIYVPEGTIKQNYQLDAQ